MINFYDAQFNPYETNKKIIKDFFKRKTVLAIAILCLLSVILAFVTALSMTNNADVISQFVDLYSEEAIPVEISGVQTVISTVFSCIPVILTAVAYFIIYFKSKNESSEANPKAGFTILYVLAIISLVMICLMAAIMLLMIVLMIALTASATSAQDGAEELMIFLIIMSLIFVAVLALAIVIIANTVRFWGSVRKSLSGPTLERKGAMFTGVVYIISAVISMVYMLMMVVLLFVSLPATLSLDSPMYMISHIDIVTRIATIVSMAISSVLNLLIGILAVKYSSYIKGFTEGTAAYAQFTQPDFPAPDQTIGYSYEPQGYAGVQNQAPQNIAQPDAAPEQQAEATAYCPQCGSPVDPSFAFCTSCGAKIN